MALYFSQSTPAVVRCVNKLPLYWWWLFCGLLPTSTARRIWHIEGWVQGVLVPRKRLSLGIQPSISDLITGASLSRQEQCWLLAV